MCQTCGCRTSDCKCDEIEEKYHDLFTWVKEVIQFQVEKAVSEHNRDYDHKRTREW